MMKRSTCSHHHEVSTFFWETSNVSDWTRNNFQQAFKGDTSSGQDMNAFKYSLLFIQKSCGNVCFGPAEQQKASELLHMLDLKSVK